MTLEGKTLLITGAARRIGRHLALACAQAGADCQLTSQDVSLTFSTGAYSGPPATISLLVSEALLFLLSGPSFITGEILHVDGGRHLL